MGGQNNEEGEIVTFEKVFPGLKGKAVNAKPFGKMYSKYVIEESCLDKVLVKKAIQKIMKGKYGDRKNSDEYIAGYFDAIAKLKEELELE
jgi:hypothetical protein